MNPIWVDVLIFGAGLVTGAVGMVLYLAFGVKDVEVEPPIKLPFPLQTSKTFWFGFRRNKDDTTIIQMRIQGEPVEVFETLKITMSKAEAVDLVSKIVSMLE